MELQALSPPQSAPLVTPQQLTVIQVAIQAGATPDQLERLLDLQVRADNHQLELMREKRRMDEEDRKAAAVLAFRSDFAAFRGENIIVPKSKFVDRGKAGSFYQAEYGAAMQLLSPPLSKHGFSIRHNEVFGSKKWVTDGVENDIPWVYVTCYLEHRDGHSEKLDLEGPPGDMSANTPVQNMQVTGSYLKRQSALAITGTATADEDNENRMRNRAPRSSDDADAGPDPLDALRATGQEKAMEGMTALTAWWGSLTSRQRTDLSPEFKVWRRAAATADQQPQTGAAK